MELRDGCKPWREYEDPRQRCATQWYSRSTHSYTLVGSIQPWNLCLYLRLCSHRHYIQILLLRDCSKVMWENLNNRNLTWVPYFEPFEPFKCCKKFERCYCIFTPVDHSNVRHLHVQLSTWAWSSENSHESCINFLKFDSMFRRRNIRPQWTIGSPAIIILKHDFSTACMFEWKERMSKPDWMFRKPDTAGG